MDSWTVAHDFLYQVGGAERVTAAIASKVFHQAPVLALAGSQQVTAELGLTNVRFVGGPGFTRSNYRQRGLFSPLVLGARAPIDGNLISSSYAFAHHFRATGSHIVYCHSPLRQIWSGAEMYAEASFPSGLGIRVLGRALRALDVRAANSATGYIATNEIVASRVRGFYGIEPLAVIPPPIDPRFFGAAAYGAREDFFVWAGRIVEPYKRLGLVIEAFNRSGERLVVAGDGRDATRIRRAAHDNITFLGHQNTSELAMLYSRAKALIFSSKDDFGMVPIEAMACGTPVIAWGEGGALGTVTDDTGVFFYEASASSLLKAVDTLNRREWDHRLVSKRAEAFSMDSFVRQMQEVVVEVS